MSDRARETIEREAAPKYFQRDAPLRRTGRNSRHVSSRSKYPNRPSANPNPGLPRASRRSFRARAIDEELRERQSMSKVAYSSLRDSIVRREARSRELFDGIARSSPAIRSVRNPLRELIRLI